MRGADFDGVHAYASDPVVVRFMPWGPNSEAETSEFLAQAQAMASVEPRLGYDLAVIHAESGQLLGAIGLHKEDAQSDDAMLGYCFGRPAWGQGYATEAALAVVQFGFDTLGLSSVWAGCDRENAGSVRVLEKVGMTETPDHARHEASLMFRIQSSDWREPGRSGA